MSSNSGTTTMQIATQKSDVVAEYQALVDGINGDPSVTDPIVLADRPYTRAELTGTFSKRIAAAQATKAARAALQQCVADEKNVEEEVVPLRNSFKGYLKARFGKKSPKLQKFGFTPNKTAKPQAATKAAAVQKGKATRALRGTKGKKQKAQLKATTVPVAGASVQSAPAGASAPAQVAVVTAPGTAPVIAPPAAPVARPAAPSTPSNQGSAS